MPTSILTPSTSKAALKTSFVKATYVERVKASQTNLVAKGKINVLPKKLITPPKVRISAPKQSIIGVD